MKNKGWPMGHTTLMLGGPDKVPKLPVGNQKLFTRALDELEKEHLLSAFEYYNWNVEITAEALEIPVDFLYDKLNDYGLNYEKPKEI